ncbi:acyl carrier protein [Saccharothrix coeruleofusca]|uniref:hypothetical protein n=1 Tax=Saccharothrix coeruleofusca TaxID=33919 RepID=UPI001AE5BF89|nr:hypothetical protein [Saccharothrix coeruleofusca]MBP2336684.1 acyl carrier protein [Saccharothrix coeruleofusca]
MDVLDDAGRAVVAVLVAEAAHPVEVAVRAGTPLAGGGLELTSLELMRALFKLEEALDVELDEAISDSELRTVGDVVEAVRRSQGG